MALATTPTKMTTAIDLDIDEIRGTDPLDTDSMPMAWIT